MTSKPSTSRNVEEYISTSASSSEEVSLLQIKKRKKKSYAQKYQKKWEEDDAFKGWLQTSKKGATYAFCRVCNKDLVCGKSELLRHSEVTSHKNKSKSLLKQQTLKSMTKFQTNVDLSNNIKKAEIRFAAFAAEHNLSFNVMDHLSEVIRVSFFDSEIAKGYTNNRTKATAIINKVTGVHGFEKTLNLIKNNKFSLIVDESTDKSGTKSLALVARVCNAKKVDDLFLGLLPVASATADSLYQKIRDFFVEHNIDYKKNLIGFGADGASAMMGIHNSLSVKLKNDVPNMFILKCTCHSFSLCANYACQKLPGMIEDLARDVHTYLQYSFKRQTELLEFQEFVNVKPHKILQPSQTRWLSLHQVVVRLLEQYNALVLYFTDQVSENVEKAQSILYRLKDPSVKLYYHFLDFVLPFFTKLNVEMQSESTKIHTLYGKIENVLRTLLDCFIRKEYLEKTPIENIEYKNPHFFLPIEEVYLGAYVIGSIANKTHNLNVVELQNFRTRCLDFLIESCAQIYKRFDAKSTSMKILKDLSIISPEQVISKKHITIASLGMHFPNLVPANKLNDLDREWRQLRNIDMNELNNVNVSEFWTNISEMKHADETFMFPTLSQFIFDIMCLPHSSATVERTFSTINLNKTKIRNKLSTETLSGILHTKNLMKNQNCFTINIDEVLIKKVTNNMYE